MKLTKTHRSALLIKMEEAKTDLHNAHIKVNNSSNNTDENQNYFEICHYLAKEKVRIITEALTENEIDY